MKHSRGTNQTPQKRILAVWNNQPTQTATVWFADATMTPERLGELLDRPVINKTPGGRLELQHKAVQLVRDITRGTSRKIVQNILRGVLADRPQFMKVGLIGHRPHISSVEELGEPFSRRIVKSAYFGSGNERSSNQWYRECDLIIVAGTPRVKPSVIRGYLCQRGEYVAAGDDPAWGDTRWLGHTESGREHVVKGRGYEHPAWRQAHRELVRAALVQAVGRGRGVLPDGCEVVVLSNEECGLRLSDELESKPLNESEAEILEAMQELSAENPKSIIGKAALNSAAIANRVGLSKRQTQDLLSGLESRGLVRRVGERGGWLLVRPETDAA